MSMSDESMVERVARAMMDNLVADDGPWSFARGEDAYTVTLDGMFDLRDLARAAIAALREPLHEAIMTASDPEQGMHLATLGAVGRRLEAMINAALSS